MNYRKIVQIAAVSGGVENASDTVYALAADGTVWWLSDNSDKWHMLPRLPEPERPRGEPLA
jgi:hypothetical protein